MPDGSGGPRPVRWLPAIIYAAFLLGLGSIPHAPHVGGGTPADKVLHLVAYAPLGVLVARAALAGGRLGVVALLSAVAATLAVGALDEWHQRYIPGRVCDPLDAAADVLGGFIGGVVWVLWRRRPPGPAH